MLSCNKPGGLIRRKLMREQLKNYKYTTYINESNTGCNETDVANGHLSIWSKLKFNEWYLIIEDDIIVDNLNVDYIPEGASVVTLFPDGIHHKHHADNFYDILLPDNHSIRRNWGLCGYYIKSCYAIELSEKKNVSLPIDHYLFGMVDNDQYVTKKQNVIHKRGWSIKSRALN